MRKIFISGLSLLLCFSAFACGRHSIRPSKYPAKKIVLEKQDGRGFRPYVINGVRYYPLSDADGFVQYGNASWYGKKFHGRSTANGERFDMYRKSAAHKTLPLGTYVKAVHLTNKKQVIVRINDRGPFVKGRIIDFSYAAAKEIGLVGPGIARVKIIALGREIGEIESTSGRKPLVEIRDLKRGEFTIQVGAFKDRDNAIRLSNRLKVLFDYVDVEAGDDQVNGRVYRVRVSKSKDLVEAGKIENKLESIGFETAFIVSL